MKTIKNIALLMFLVWIFQLGFNSCANLVKDFVVNKNIIISCGNVNENILEKHRLIYGIIGGLAAKKHNKDIEKGFRDGVLAGEIAYFGKGIARKKGLGLFGKVVHSLGISMLENQILNKPLFSRYKVFLPPNSLEFDIQRGFDCKILLGSTLGIFANFIGIENIVEIDKVKYITGADYSKYIEILIVNAKAIRLRPFESGDKFLFIDSLLSGNIIFRFKEDLSSYIDGINIMGIITVNDLDTFPHEIIHSLQYREAGILNLLVERNLCLGAPILFSQDFGYLLLLPLLEEEAGAYDEY